MELENVKKYISGLVEKGGPDPEDYLGLSRLVNEIANHIDSVGIATNDLHELHSTFGDSLTVETMQGMALQKPYGYAGDFEIIERIHTHWVSPHLHLRKWDLFFHAQAAPKAVRNRKDFFHRLLGKLHNGLSEELWVLNVGSGPGRDLNEFLSQNPKTAYQFDCVDVDDKAIEYASSLCADYADKCNFYHKNIFKFSPPRQYDLVWSAGLFDYLDDKAFKVLLKKLLKAVKPNGNLIVGNFSNRNPSRAYMEVIGEWYLHHRSENDLHKLAIECDIDPSSIWVATEPKGVNLFLKIVA